MTLAFGESQVASLFASLRLDRARAGHIAAASQQLLAATRHLHGLTKTIRPLVDVAAALWSGGGPDGPAIERLKRPVPGFSARDRRTLLGVVRLLSDHAPSGPPPDELAVRMVPIIEIAVALDHAGKQGTRLLGVWDTGRAIELIVSGKGDVLDNAAAALRAAERWNATMPRPIGAVRISDGAAPGAGLVRPDHSLGRAFEKIRQRQLEEMTSRVYGLWRPEDAEYVHEMRVALRRLRAALRVFAKVLSGVKSFKRDIQRLADLLGGARDVDVFLEFLRGYAADLPQGQHPFLNRLVAAQRRQRRTRYAALVAFFGSEEYRQFLGHCGEGAGRSPRPRGKGARRPVCEAAPGLLMKRLRRVFSLGTQFRNCQPDELHALRIQCKRLRYTAEVFADIYPGRLAELIEHTRRLQGALGEIHDADVYMDRVNRYAGRLRGRGGPDRNAAEALLGHLVSARMAALAEAGAGWKEFAAGGARQKWEGLVQSPRRT